MGQGLVIYGAGGFGREVLQIVKDLNRVAPTWDCRGFLVDSGFVAEQRVHGLPVLGDAEWLRNHVDVQVIVAVGSPAGRRRITRRIAAYGNQFATLIHPRAWIGDHVEIPAGCVICAGALITTDIFLGAHTHVNIGSTIGHDAKISDFVTISPGCNVSGGVRLEEGVELGSGAVIVPGVSVGAWSVIGANAVVSKDIPRDCTAVGMPARPIKFRQANWQDA